MKIATTKSVAGVLRHTTGIAVRGCIDPLLKQRMVLMCLATTAAALVVDVFVPLGVAGVVLYVVVVLTSMWSQRGSLTLAIAAVATLLTVVGFILSPRGGELWMVITNRLLTVSIIWIAASLCLWQQRQRRQLARLYNQNLLLASEHHELTEALELVSRQQAELADMNAKLPFRRSWCWQ